MSALTRNLFHAAAAIAALTFIDHAEADAGINFNSAIGATNVQSDGSPMDGVFAFEIGTFIGGFTPTATNTDGWLAHWSALADAASDPLATATASYSTVQLPPPFSETTSGFSGSTFLDHNQPPFVPMGAVYVWGFDNRTAAGPGEWILFTASTWGWPVGTSNAPATTYSVSDADTVILGAIDQDGIHMRSASVEVEASQASGYNAWLAENFSAGTLADPAASDTTWGVLADPDADGLANIIEFFTATDPNDPSSKRLTTADVDEAGENLLFTFYRAKDTTGAAALIEWSSDMVHWHTEGVEIAEVEELEDVERVVARVPMNAAESFARLNVFRALD